MRPKPDHFDKIEKMTYSIRFRFINTHWLLRIIPKSETLSDVLKMVWVERKNGLRGLQPDLTKQFERGDYHVIWYAFVLRIWHFRTNFSNKFFLIFSSKSWFDRLKSVKRRTIWICQINFSVAKSVKRMHIRSHDNRLFRIVFVRSGCKPRMCSLQDRFRSNSIGT